MSGFDQAPIFFTDSFSDVQSLTNDMSSRSELISRFKRFLKEFQTLNYIFCYRDTLKKNFYLGENYIKVDLDHLASYDNDLCERLLSRPNEHIVLFETAAEILIKELALLSNDDPISTKIQIIIKSGATPISIRDLKSDMVSKLVKIPGVVINASTIRSKAVKITLQCRSCQTTIPNISLIPGLDGYALPRKCPSNQPGSVMNSGARPQCPMDPFYVVPDKCECIDFQILKLQEPPESNPTGEIPRHVTLYCDRYLVERVTPGTRVTITGIYSIKKISSSKGKGEGSMDAGIRKPYVRVVGIDLERPTIGVKNNQTQSSISGNTLFTVEEENMFRKFATRPNVYETIAKNIAPSIYGCEDMKKSLACLLFGGSRKRLPDGLIRRGDINILLLGDPGTAKSQLLKFVEKVAPIAYYTSGKGSSAAGLTASLNRDANSRGFVIEGGAMVLADGGVVCIDEFDKMREDDRVAIHEAMEQQTISIAKAGITTKLNSRCAVLAAANSVFGRWDNTKGDKNIEFMPTILSRFDMIYIVKDEHNAQRDMRLADHVLQVHIDSGSDRRFTAATNETNNIDKGELSIDFLTRYIAYCKQNCAPRLTAKAAEKLKHCYVQLRNRSRQIEKHLSKKASITITVRQLEAIVRISESLAKMCLENFATESHVEEAIRLFKMSTLEAASSGSLTGAEGFLAREDMDEIRKIEKQIKQRFAIGTQVTENRIVQDLLKQKFSETSIQNVIGIMLRRGEIQHRLQRKIIYRVR